MAVTERTRHELHEALVELMGPEKAETLMKSLPPIRWEDIVTKDYLDLRLDALEARLTSVIDSRLRQADVTVATIVISLSTVMIALILALR